MSKILFVFFALLWSCQNPFERSGATIDIAISLQTGEARSLNHGNRAILPEMDQLIFELFKGSTLIRSKTHVLTPAEKIFREVIQGFENVPLFDAYRLQVRAIVGSTEVAQGQAKIKLTRKGETEQVRVGLLPGRNNIIRVAPNTGGNSEFIGDDGTRLFRFLHSGDTANGDFGVSDLDVRLYDERGLKPEGGNFSYDAPTGTFTMSGFSYGHYLLLVENRTGAGLNTALLINDATLITRMPNLEFNFTYANELGLPFNSASPIYIGIKGAPVNQLDSTSWDTWDFQFKPLVADGLVSFDGQDQNWGIYDYFVVMIIHDLDNDFLLANFLSNPGYEIRDNASFVGLGLEESDRFGYLVQGASYLNPGFKWSGITAMDFVDPTFILQALPTPYLADANTGVPRYFPGNTFAISDSGLRYPWPEEPNNAKTNPKDIGVVGANNSGMIRAKSSISADEDWYRFVPPAPGAYVINVTDENGIPGAANIAPATSMSLTLEDSTFAPLVVGFNFGGAAVLAYSFNASDTSPFYFNIFQPSTPVNQLYNIWIEGP
jgi:hypothetical protein